MNGSSSSPPLEKCLCAFPRPRGWLPPPTPDKVTCSDCGYRFHVTCMKMPAACATQEYWVCVPCRAMWLDPFAPAVGQCLEGTELDPHSCLAKQQYPLPGVTVGSIMNGSTANVQNIDFYLGQRVYQHMTEGNVHVEARCFLGNHPHENKPPYQRFTHRWPLHCQLDANNVNCSALQQTEQRSNGRTVKDCNKDKPLVVPRDLLRPGHNTITLTFFDHQDHVLVLGLFGVRPPNVVVEEVKHEQTMSYSDARKRMKASFGKWDGDLGPSSTTISLECPVTMQRIQTPARGKTCKHLECFDLGSHVQSAKESKDPPKWMCPICEQPARPHQMKVDPWVGHVLKELPLACSKVEVQPDGQFGPEQPTSCSSNRKRKAEVIEVDES